MSPAAVRRVVLVGFMGSGKSTVGPILARSLSWRFLDFDEEIEAREGLTVAEIFRLRGEAHFRRVEDLVAARLLQEDGVVLGSGGGWAAVPERLDHLPEGTVSVWLKVGVAEAVARSAAQAGVRPLLAGVDPAAAARALLVERARGYGRAQLVVDTDGRTPEDVTADILVFLERHGSGPTGRGREDARRSEPRTASG